MVRMIVCAGPISSGTRLLTAVVNGLGVDAFHSSLPSGPNGMPYETDAPVSWWTYGDFPKGSRFILITRDAKIVVESIKARADMPDIPKDPVSLKQMYQKAIDTMNDIPNAYRLDYQDLVDDPLQQMSHIAAWLGVRVLSAPSLAFEVYDANEKYR